MKAGEEDGEQDIVDASLLWQSWNTTLSEKFGCLAPKA